MKTKILHVLISGMLIMYAAGNTAYAQAGTLDSSFSGDGKLTTDFGGNDMGNAVAVQSDGKIVVAGTTNAFGGDYDIVLARYNSNGTPDASFSGNGKIGIGFKGADEAHAIALQKDGKIIVAGSTTASGGDLDFLVFRFNTDGTVDHTFGSNGKAITGFGHNEIAYAIAIQPNGKIVVAGTSYVSGSLGFPIENNFAVARYNSNGTLDHTFNSSGKVITDINSGNNDVVRGVAIQQDGKIIAVGYTSPSSGNDNFALARYNSDGSLDHTFGGNGLVATDFGGIDDANAVAIQPNGKIILAGHSSAYGDGDFALARYHSNGTLDASFAGNGKLATGFGLDDIATSVFIQPDGRIVAGGYTHLRQNPPSVEAQHDDAPGSSTNDFALARYNTDGTLDHSFSGDGKLLTDFGGTEVLTGIALQPDGKILAAGYTSAGSNDNFAIARYYGADVPSPAITSSPAIENKMNNTRAASIRLYPNPVADVLHIEGLNPSSSATITISSLSGNLFQKETVTGSGHTFNVSMLKQGEYIATIAADGKVISLKFIKQ